MTDAAHLLSDVSGFGVSLFAAWYAARKSHSTHTFGYHRLEASALFQPETELSEFHGIRLPHCLPQSSACALLLRIYDTPRVGDVHYVKMLPLMAGAGGTGKRAVHLAGHGENPV